MFTSITLYTLQKIHIFVNVCIGIVYRYAFVHKDSDIYKQPA